MSSSQYMALLIVSALPSFVITFNHLYRKKPPELKKKSMDHENNNRNSQVLPVYEVVLSEAQMLAIKNKLAGKVSIFHTPAGHTKSLATDRSV